MRPIFNPNKPLSLPRQPRTQWYRDTIQLIANQIWRTWLNLTDDCVHSIIINSKVFWKYFITSQNTPSSSWTVPVSTTCRVHNCLRSCRWNLILIIGENDNLARSFYERLALNCYFSLSGFINLNISPLIRLQIFISIFYKHLVLIVSNVQYIFKVSLSVCYCYITSRSKNVCN